MKALWQWHQLIHSMVGFIVMITSIGSALFAIG
jgi:hypothetical protein